MHDDEISLLRRRVELQQRTIETLREGLKRAASQPKRVTISPCLVGGLPAHPGSHSANAISLPWWPAIAFPDSALSPPAGLGCYSLSGADVAVIGFGVFELEGKKLEEMVSDIAERQRASMNFVPIFLTDCAEHSVFRQRGYAFEYFPKLVYGPPADALAFQDRLLVAWKKWGMGALIDLGAADYLKKRLAGTRIPELAAAIAPPEPSTAKYVPSYSVRKIIGAETHAQRNYYRLWGGFSQPSLDALHQLIRSGPTKEQFLAAWSLVRWYADQGDYQRALDFVALMRTVDKDRASEAAVSLVEAECLLRLGRADQARALLDSQLHAREELNVDLCLAYANTLSLVDDPSADEARLVWINRPLLESGFAPIEKADPSKSLTIDNLAAPSARFIEIQDAPKVSIIMPAYNAAGVIRTAIESVLAQTWPNLELIVVDDCSTDKTWDIVRCVAARHEGIIPIRPERNQGAYAARNVGLAHATGDLFTTHDADDWSHPQKIEAQVRNLVANPDLVALRSCWVRAADNLRFECAWEPGTAYSRANWSSFMFGKNVKEALGRWDEVRVGADEEFIQRTQRIFGNSALRIAPADVPLSFGRVTPNSLTGAQNTHLRTLYHGSRRDYSEAFRRWHHRTTDLNALKLGPTNDPRPFPAPGRLLPDTISSNSYDYIFVFDFTESTRGGSYKRSLNYVRYCLQNGLRVGVFLWQRFDLTEKPLNQEMVDLIDNFRVDLIGPGDRVSANAVIVGQPQIAQYPIDNPPICEFNHLVLIVDQTAYRFRGDRDRAYDPRMVRQTLIGVFGTEGYWVPVSPLVRRIMEECDSYPRPYGEDWTAALDFDAYHHKPLIWRGDARDRPVIGRHGRDHYTKWPSEPRNLLDAYCAEKPCSIRILGGADGAAVIIGRIPTNWEVHPWGAMPIPDFLDDVDFFIHYPHEDCIEASGTVVAEAMAAGRPAILPPFFKEIYGSAAIYAEPSEVWDTIASLWRDKDAYLAAAKAGRDYSQHCSIDRFGALLRNLGATNGKAKKNRGGISTPMVHPGISNSGTPPDTAMPIILNVERLQVQKAAADRGNERMVDVVTKLREDAEAALARGPSPVTDKTVLPPSGDPHDYLHPGPYWWPNPETPDGLPYVFRDGLRAPGTRLYEPESDKYDRTRAQYLFDDVTTLTLAWYFVGDRRYARHAAKLLRTWFVNKQTRMSPHLRYAQIKLGVDQEGSSYGIIEFKDLYYMLDAVKLLGAADVIGKRTKASLDKWFADYLEWLLTSEQGGKECASQNNHGIFYDLQVLSIAHYLGNWVVVRKTLDRAMTRVSEHFDVAGRQPNEMKRSITKHYCAFNLQGWANLSLAAGSLGADVSNYKAFTGGSLEQAFRWFLLHYRRDWPYEQIEPFNEERFVPLFHAYKRAYPSADISGVEQQIPEPLEIEPRFWPHDGIRPYWQLG